MALRSRRDLAEQRVADHHAPIVRNYYFEGPLVDVAERLVGPNVKAATSQLTFKHRGNTQSFGWHHDNADGELEPHTAISCLTALDDADVENGRLRVIPGSGTRVLFAGLKDSHYEGCFLRSTGGSTGVPTQFYMTRESYEWQLAVTNRGYGYADAKPGRRAVFIWSDPAAQPPYDQRMKQAAIDQMRPKLGDDCKVDIEKAERLRDLSNGKTPVIICEVKEDSVV